MIEVAIAFHPVLKNRNLFTKAANIHHGLDVHHLEKKYSCLVMSAVKILFVMECR